MYSAEVVAIAPESIAGADRAPSISLYRLWTFWLPLMLVLVTSYSVEHNTYYASQAFLDDGDGKNVIELISGGSSMRQLSLLALGGMGAVWLVLPAKSSIRPSYLSLSLIVIAFTFLFLSVLWTEDWNLTIKRGTQPALLMIAALGLAKHWRPRDLCMFTAICTSAILLAGVFAVASAGTFWQGDAYRFGGTLHPNAQAVNCAVLGLSAIAMFVDARKSGHYAWPWLAVLAISLLFLLLTRSRSTLAAFLTAASVFMFVGVSWPKRLSMLCVFGIMILFGGILMILPDTGAGRALNNTVSMGRSNADATSLTGRLPIWETVLHDIAKSPVVGYGYGGFWTSQRIWEYSFIHRWEFNHAHSVYFETLLNAGLVGLFLGLAIIVRTMWLAARSYSDSGDTGYQFIIALIAVALVQGLADSNFVQMGFAPLSIMMCVAVAALHAPARRPAVATMPVTPPSFEFRTALNY